MPGLEEVLFYMRGILELVRRNPVGWRNLDITPRGVNRSFWAMAWSLPGLLISWLAWRAAFMQYGGEGDTGVLFIARLALLDLLVWMLQIIIAAILLIYLKKEHNFNAMVVATNWLAVPFSLYTGLLAGLQMLLPSAMVLWWILLNIELAAAVFATFAVFRMMKGITNGPAIGLAISTLSTSLIVTPILQNYLGLS